jgi:hypothetical protein
MRPTSGLSRGDEFDMLASQALQRVADVGDQGVDLELLVSIVA